VLLGNEGAHCRLHLSSCNRPQCIAPELIPDYTESLCHAQLQSVSSTARHITHKAGQAENSRVSPAPGPAHAASCSGGA
jgi:hypothetical protein